MSEETIKGKITKVFHANKDNGFCVLVVEPADKMSQDLIKKKSGNNASNIRVVGTLYGPQLGDEVVIKGRFENHHKYKMQFSSETMVYSHLLSNDFSDEFAIVENMELASREMIMALTESKGVDNVFQVLEQCKSGAGGVEKPNMRGGYTSNSYSLRYLNNYSFLRSLGLSVKSSVFANDSYRGDSIVSVMEDPFSLLNVPSIGKVAMDRVSASLRISDDARSRHNHYTNMELEAVIERGHTAILASEFNSIIQNTLRVNKDEATEKIRFGLANLGMYYDKDYNKRTNLSLVQQGHAERKIAEDILRIATSPLKRGFSSSFKVEQGRLKDGQYEAVKSTLNSKLSIITGGPGRGKTTVVKDVLKQIKEADGESNKIMLLAPTGLAATKLTQSTGVEAVTIHSALGYDPTEGFRRDSFDALNADTIVIDECSMMDVVTFSSLMDSIPSSARVIMLGDVDQLPSVGAGRVLGDMIDSGRIVTSELTEPVRYRENSGINKVAMDINMGNAIDFEGLDDVFWFDAETDDQIIDLVNKVARVLPSRLGGSYENIQILTPKNGSQVGVKSINSMLKDVFNPPDSSKQEHKIFGEVFRVGDRVMQLKNQKEYKISNGDDGYIVSFDTEADTYRVRFEREEKDLPMSNLALMKHSLCKTIHKSQGSEFDYVIIPFSKSDRNMWTRETLYTGLTRTAKRFIGIGNKEVMNDAIKILTKYSRNTLLKDQIMKAFDEYDYNKKMSADMEKENRVSSAFN